MFITEASDEETKPEQADNVLIIWLLDTDRRKYRRREEVRSFEWLDDLPVSLNNRPSNL